MTKSPAESLVKKYKKLYDKTKLSAKNVHFKAYNTPTLPWKSPSKDKFYGTRAEILEKQLKYLKCCIIDTNNNREKHNIGVVNPTDDSVIDKNAAVSALYNNLVKLQLQQHELNIESKQQTKFRQWIMGEA